MDPASIAIAATIASTVVSAQGAAKQSEATADAAMYNAGVARNNQIIADRYAQMELERGKIDEQTNRMKLHQAEGSQRAALAASGVTIDSGSPLALQSDLARAGETDSLTIRNNALKSAYQYRVGATSDAAQADLYSMQAQSAKSAGNYNVAASIIGGASSVADKWAKYKQVGAWS